MARAWRNLVAEGRRAVKAQEPHQWQLGDLALEVEARGDSLQEYADEIGIALKTLNEYRRVAVAWERSARRLAVSWSVHEEFATEPDRANLIKQKKWTQHEARLRMGQKGMARVSTPSSQAPTPQQVVQSITSSPSVAQHVARSTPAMGQIAQASSQQVSQAQAAQAARSPAVANARRQREVVEFAKFINSASYGISKRLSSIKAQKLAKLDRDLILDEVKRLRATLDWVESFANTGSTQAFHGQIQQFLAHQPGGTI